MRILKIFTICCTFSLILSACGAYGPLVMPPNSANTVNSPNDSPNNITY